MNTAYLVAGVRSPIGRYGGALASVRPDDLAAHVIRCLTERLPSVAWDRVDDVIMGCTNQAGEDNRNVARMAALLAGLPETVPGVTVNRLCGSGMEAVALAARAVRCGEADLVVAGGVECMTRAPYVMPKQAAAFGRSPRVYDTTIGWRMVNPAMEAAYGTDSMPETAQNLAEEMEISRQDQDEFSLRSQMKAAEAIRSGRLAREIAAVPVPGRKGAVSLFEVDEHPRETSYEKLAALPSILPGGSITAGNSSGVNDGAVAVLVASERAVAGYGLTPLARITAAAAAGVAPRVMGIGPVPATAAVLGRTGLTLADMDVIELNEAFAAQALAVLRQLGIGDDEERVNVNGGAIALGHPVGASGARLALTLAFQLADRDRGRGLATMCVGVGQGVSMLLEAP